MKPWPWVWLDADLEWGYWGWGVCAGFIGEDDEEPAHFAVSLLLGPLLVALCVRRRAHGARS